MNRIDRKLAHLKSLGQKGLVIYAGAGDPDLQATRDLAIAFDRAGVDILELGVPFSDPLADGLVNQLAAQRGLESGTTPQRIFDTIAEIRQHSEIPLVLYVYFNILHRFGLKTFIQHCSQSGVDGLLVLDLPPEESENYEVLMNDAGLCPIYLMAPTTPDERIGRIAARAKGFIYYVSREGVTGMQSQISNTIGEMTAKIRRHTDLPIAVGFGISDPEQAKAVSQHAEAIVVGSAVVDRIAKLGKSPNMVSEVAAFVASLSQAIKS